MTEPEWLAGTAPSKEMWAAFNDHTSDRKTRLLAVACLRRVWALFYDPRCRHAVETAERMADGLVTEADRKAAAEAANAVIAEMREADPISTSKEFDFRIWAEVGAVMSLDPNSGRALDYAQGIASALWMSPTPVSRSLKVTEKEDVMALMRDAVGNPFRPITFTGAWRNGEVVSLAKASYDERALPSGHLDCARLAILADAIEEAGCFDLNILGHLRGPGPHIRGCWAVDLCLGMESQRKDRIVGNGDSDQPADIDHELLLPDNGHEADLDHELSLPENYNEDDIPF